MKILKNKFVLFIFVLIILIIGLGVTTKDNWRLEERMAEKDVEYQEMLDEYKNYSDSTSLLLTKWETLVDSLAESNKQITEDQFVTIVDLTEQRKKNHEKISNIRTWSNDERDEFWATESQIRDTLIDFSIEDNP